MQQDTSVHSTVALGSKRTHANAMDLSDLKAALLLCMTIAYGHVNTPTPGGCTQSHRDSVGLT